MKTLRTLTVVLLGAAVFLLPIAQPLYAATDNPYARIETGEEKGPSPTGDTWVCPNCKKMNPGDAIYCSDCGTERAETTKSISLDVQICPECGFANAKDARFCGKCRAEFTTVFVPGRGYVPRGTLIEPSHTRSRLWISGLFMWLAAGPAITVISANGDFRPGVAIGGAISVSGLIMFIVGLTVKTDPVYASLEIDTPALTLNESFTPLSRLSF